MAWRQAMCAAALLAGACATGDAVSARHVARLAESCRAEGLGARQCRCYANRVRRDVTQEELAYLAAQIDDPARAEEMAAVNPELASMGLANRVLIAMGACGRNRGGEN